jgi:benzoyl-CoA reductase/2-hydroxyglutaryl-CoA dehydratase subunit BcrC/BadD/HgdB
MSDAPDAVPPSAIETLTRAFAQPLRHARDRHEAGTPVAGAVAHTVPWELLRAAGLSPLVIRPTRSAGAAGAEWLDPGVFSPRICGLFESALAGELNFLSAIVFARTSEQDYKAYLALREVAREGRADGLPALLFYDLLYSVSQHAYEYGLARTRALAAELEQLTGRAVTPETLDAAIQESNAARAAARALQALRRHEPRLRGTEALALLGSFFLLDRASYADLAARAAREAEQRAPLPGPRLLLAGAWVDDDRLHALIESHGAVVVAEDGGWGTRGAGHDIARGVLDDGSRQRLSADLTAAIFDKYYRDGPSVRQFPPADRNWLHDTAASDIDGVVFYLPPDDSVMGWDVPRERHRLDGLGIPSLVLRDDITRAGAPDRCHDALSTFVRRATRAA